MKTPQPLPVEPLPVEPYPNPNALGRVALGHKPALVAPPFTLSEMGEGRPDRHPLRTPPPHK